MNVNELLDRLGNAVSLVGDDAAVRIRARYEAQAGAGAKVFPPTYIAGDPGIRSTYHLEKRWDADGNDVDVVVLDSVQSEANRCEVALARAAEDLGLPQIVMVTEVGGRAIRISSLEAPHRSRDAYLLDSEIDGEPFDGTEVGEALNSVTPLDATEALRYAPYDLVYGVWDSHRGKRMPIRFPRVYTSEMLGWDVQRGKRAATKGDSLNLPGSDEVDMTDWRPEATSNQKKKAKQKLSELGHGMVPNAPSEEAGGVSVKTIERIAVLSLTGLAQLRFGSAGFDLEARTALAALALIGDRLAFGGAGINLRSGSDLVRISDQLEWVRAGGATEPFELDIAAARDLLSAASARLAERGVAWSAEPIIVAPSPRLLEKIEQTFEVADFDAGE